jgi:alcohol dehydrogenase class IV
MTDPFRFEYRPGTIRYGPDCVADLGTELDRLGAQRAMVVCGQTVGSSPAVMDPVRGGLGDRLAGTFDRTTPAKSIATAIEAADRARELDAGALVAVGGGSSLDVAKVAAALAGGERSREEVLAAFARRGTVPVAEDPLAVLSVPTTLAGADLSQVAGIDGDPETLAQAVADPPVERVHGGVGDSRLFPAAVFYDPELFRTTPESVLTASAMNGFDKALETPYAATATPVTDATAQRALRLLARGLPALGSGDRDEETMHDAVVGTVLAQYGASRPDATTLSVIHAFGHAFARPYEIQQGAAHGIAAPVALRYVFERVDGRRRLIAEGLGVDARGMDDDAVGEAVVTAVEDVRDALGLPARVREVPGIERDHLPDVAQAVVEDGFAPNAPVELDAESVAAALRDAW